MVPGEAAVLTVRPEALRILPSSAAEPGGGENFLKADIREAVFMGDHQRVRLLAGAQCLVCKLPAGQAGGAALAGAAGLGFDTGSAFVFSSAAREAQ